MMTSLQSVRFTQQKPLATISQPRFSSAWGMGTGENVGSAWALGHEPSGRFSVGAGITKAFHAELAKILGLDELQQDMTDAEVAVKNRPVFKKLKQLIRLEESSEKALLRITTIRVGLGLSQAGIRNVNYLTGYNINVPKSGQFEVILNPEAPADLEAKIPHEFQGAPVLISRAKVGGGGAEM